MGNWESIRTEYPLVQNFTYLNTPVLGAISKKTSEISLKFTQELLESGPYNYAEWVKGVQSVRTGAARLINASPNDIAFVSDVATGMNFLTRMLPVNGGEVVLYEKDFPSIVLPWINHKHRIVKIPADCKGEINPELLDKLFTAHTKILVLSYVQYDTGYKIDIEAIGKLCKEKNILFVVDATQAIGACEINVITQNIDVLLASTYKWALGGYGTALLYLSPDLLRKDFPALGWHSLIENTGKNDLKNLKTSVAALEIGHPKFQNILMLGSALTDIMEIKVSSIQDRINFLTLYLHKKLTEKGIQLLCKFERKNLAGITMIKGTEELVNTLRAKKILCSYRGEGVRIGLHFYNNEQDIDHLVSEL